jgi:hypothetical protein
MDGPQIVIDVSFNGRSSSIHAEASKLLGSATHRFKVIRESLHDFSRVVRPSGFNCPFIATARHYAEGGSAIVLRDLTQSTGGPGGTLDPCAKNFGGGSGGPI